MDKLTENSIKKAEINEKQYKIYDGGGMFLLIHPNGSKYWRMKYTFDGKSKLASFGVWPGVSLKEAREKRFEAKQKIKMGINPVEEKRRNKQLQQNSFAEDMNSESAKLAEYSSIFDKFFLLNAPYRKKGNTKVFLQLLRSNIFDNSASNSFSKIDKDVLNEILGNVYNNRRDLLRIIWNFYLSFPILNILLLFLILLVIMDFFPALFTTVTYIIITVCAAVAFSLWEENKLQE